jgi:hypothetical protein
MLKKPVKTPAPPPEVNTTEAPTCVTSNESAAPCAR